LDIALQPIQAISLDLDDTLWDIAPVIRRAEEELWAWLGARYPRIGEQFTPESAYQLRQRIAGEQAHMAHDYRYLRKRTLARMAAAAGYAEALADDAFDVFDEARNRVELFPDVEPALERLAGRFRLIALTNGNACLERIGIDHYFDGVVSAAGVGAAKPDPAIFAAAVARVGVPARAILHVGDHPELDVAGAARAGLRTAWVNRRGGEWPDLLPPPDHTVSSMADLHDLVTLASALEHPGGT